MNEPIPRFNSLSEAFLYFNDMNGKDPNNLDCINAAYEIAQVINTEGVNDSEILIIFGENGVLHPNPNCLNYEVENAKPENWRIHVAVKTKGIIIDPLFKTGMAKSDIQTYVKNLFPPANGKISIFSMPTSSFTYLKAPKENYREINSATSFIQQMKGAGLPVKGTHLIEL